MSEYAQREVTDSWRNERPLAGGRRSPGGFGNGSGSDCTRSYDTLSNTYNNRRETANKSVASGSCVHRFSTSTGCGARCRSPSAGRTVALSSSTADALVDFVELERPERSASRALRPVELATASFDEDVPEGAMQGGAHPKLEATPVHAALRHDPASNNSGGANSTHEGVRFPSEVGFLASGRNSSVQISPRVGGGIVRRTSSVGRVRAANSTLAPLHHPPHTRTANSCRAGLDVRVRGGDARDVIPVGRCPSKPTSVALSARAVPIRSARVVPMVTNHTATANRVGTAVVPPVTLVSGNVTNDDKSSNVSTNFAVPAVSGRGTANRGNAHWAPVPREDADPNVKWQAPMNVSRRLPFGNGSIRDETKVLDECRSVVRKPTEDFARLTGQHTGGEPADIQYQKGLSRSSGAMARPLVAHSTYTTTPSVSRTSDATVGKGEDGGATTVVATEQDNKGGKSEPKGEDEEELKKNVRLSRGYVGASVGESGQRPFIRCGVQGMDGGRAHPSAAPSLAALRDHMRHNSPRMAYSLCSGRYGGDAKQKRIERYQGTSAPLMSVAPAAGIQTFFSDTDSNRNTSDNANGNNSVGCGNCKEGGGSHVVSVPPPTAGGRLERTARRPIPPALQQKSVCLLAATTSTGQPESRGSCFAADRTSSTPNGSVTDACAVYFRDSKLVSKNCGGFREQGVTPRVTAKDTEVVLPFARRVSELCATVLRDRDNRVGMEARARVCGVANGSDSLGGPSSRRLFCSVSSRRVAPSSEWFSGRDQHSQVRCGVRTVVLHRAATAPPPRQRQLKLEDPDSLDGVTGPVSASAPAASVLLHVRNMVDERRQRHHGGWREGRGGVCVGSGKMLKEEDFVVSDQFPNQHGFRAGGACGSGSSGRPNGVSGSNTSGDVTEGAEESKERVEDDGRARPLRLRRCERHCVRLRDNALTGTTSTSEEAVALPDAEVAGNSHNSVCGAEDIASHESLEPTAVGSDQHMRCSYHVAGGCDADSLSDDCYSDSDCSDEDPWWFFGYFWSTPSVAVCPPAFVPPLKFDNFRVPDDSFALTKYAIPLPTAVPQLHAGSSPIPSVRDGHCPAVSTVSASARSGSRRRRLAELKPAKAAVERKKERNISVKLLLLEAAERRERRLKQQEEVASRRTLQQRRPRIIKEFEGS